MKPCSKQGVGNFFYKGPDDKYFKLCDHSQVLNCTIVVQKQPQYYKQVGVAVLQQNLI